MKKVATWMFALAFILFVIDLGIIGAKIFSGHYDVLPEAYIAAACWVVILVCAVYKVLTNKCPHCGKVRYGKGKYCPHCGKEI